MHLQSGHGLEDAALVQAGAKSVVGIDYSAVAAGAAQRRADELGLACQYVVGSVPGVPLADGVANLVYTGKGALIWLEDLRAWGREAARLLRPGTVLSGADLGQAENLTIPTAKNTLWHLGTGAGIDIVLIALFVVAGTVELSVNQRQRAFALLLAVGATPGQVRRMLMLELAVLGAAGAVAGTCPASGWPPGPSEAWRPISSSLPPHTPGSTRWPCPSWPG